MKHFFWPLLLLCMVVILTEAAIKAAYRRGFRDGGQYVIDRVSTIIDSIQDNKPAQSLQHLSKEE